MYKRTYSFVPFTPFGSLDPGLWDIPTEKNANLNWRINFRFFRFGFASRFGFGCLAGPLRSGTRIKAMNAALILSLAAILVSGGYCEADALLLPVASEPSSPDHDGSRKFGSMCVNSWDECVNWPLANLLQGYEADPASSARTIQADSDGKMLREQRSSTVSNRGRQGYLLRTRKSMDELGKGEVRNTRGSYLFRTKKSSSSMPRHRELRGGSYLFRTRKSFNMENADEDLMDAENNEEALEDLGDQVARGHDFGGGNSEDLMQLFNRMARSNKGYLFRTRKSPSDLSNRSQRGGTYLFRT